MAAHAESSRSEIDAVYPVDFRTGRAMVKLKSSRRPGDGCNRIRVAEQISVHAVPDQCVVAERPSIDHQSIVVLGLSMQDVVAFGDNYNDLSMLEAAGTGVAMGNAVEEVKARANVVIGENESNSIADFINRNLL